MRILILGATGMLGHKLVQRLSRQHQVIAATRTWDRPPELMPGSQTPVLVDQFRAEDLPGLTRIVGKHKPQVVVNCVGVVKQLASAKDPVICSQINAMFPHLLADLCNAASARLIHISTDCVFSGNKGTPYLETDTPDPVDLYGMTKAIGEVSTPPALTLRTSIIGPELKGHVGLLGWFLQQKGKTISGYRRALYSGLTTVALSDIIEQVIALSNPPTGLWQVSSQGISKFDLLGMINQTFDWGVQIQPNDSLVCDRRLDGSRFVKATGILTPSWSTMVSDMYEDIRLTRGLANAS